jgi:hypothetical protein
MFRFSMIVLLMLAPMWIEGCSIQPWIQFHRSSPPAKVVKREPTNEELIRVEPKLKARHKDLRRK